MAPDDPWLGRTLGEHYRIEERLGGGAMGSVYRARHALLEQDFAVKVLAADVGSDPDLRRRFLVEARSLAAFTHKNAVQVRHCGSDHGALFLVMDLVDGETLADRLARDGPLPPARAAAIAIQILEALAEAHAAGIVHRDLKPGNVMVETPGADRAGPRASERVPLDRVRVVDFGLARMSGSERSAMPSAFASLGGAVVGTVAYMAPEQLRAEDDVDGRADLFAVGVVLYELLTGSLPFPGTSTMSIALRIVEREREPWPLAREPAGESALHAVVDRALEKDRERRFPSATAMAVAIREALVGVAPTPLPAASSSPPPSPPPVSARDVPSDLAASGVVGPAAAHASRGRAWAIAGALATVAVAAALLLPRGREPTASPAPDAATSLAAAERALGEGRFGEAVTRYTEAIRARPDDAALHLGRATARIGLKDRNARPDLDEAERLVPGDARTWVAKGRYLWLVEEDRKAADAAFVRALTLDARSADARAERTEMWASGQGAPSSPADLDTAEQNVAALERDAPDDPRGPWLRSIVESGRAAHADGEERGRRTDAAIAAARTAVERAGSDPRGPLALAAALQERANAEKAAGRYAASKTSLRDALAAIDEALSRAKAHPGAGGRGAVPSRILTTRAGHHFLDGDMDGAFADFDAALALSPTDPQILSARAFARQQQGDHEAAIADFERLYDVTGEQDHIFRQAFGRQRLGEGRADVGDDAGALAQYALALEIYTKAIARFPASPDLRAYRGETATLRALLRSGAERRADLDAAKADLDRALAEATTGIAEVRLRRAERALAAREPRDALADLRAAIGDRKDMTPRYYLRLAQAAIACTREPAATRPEAAAWAAEAVEAAGRAGELVPELASRTLPWRAIGHVRAAAASVMPAERQRAIAAAIEDLERASSTASEDPSTEARVRAVVAHVRAEASFVGRDARSALASEKEAVRLREAERAAGRWSLDATWYERLAEIADAAGDAETAVAARSTWSSLPR